MRIAQAVLCVAAVATVTLGCTGVPDRGREAQRLADTIAAMPGVGSADFAHENALGRGATLNGTVWMPDATPAQISDVVNRMNDVRGDRFDGYDQSVTFQITSDRHFAVECAAALDANTIAAQSVALRGLSTRITVSGADASCGTADRAMTLRDNETPIPQVLAALRSVNADLASVDIMAGQQRAGMEPFSTITIRFPFSMADWNRFQDMVSRMDGRPWSAGIGPGPAVNALGVAVRSAASAYQQLSNVIAEFGAGPRQPLWLSWGLENPPGGDALTFQGRVDVGGCRYGTPTMGDENPEKYYTRESIELQTRMRAQYDTCGK